MDEDLSQLKQVSDCIRTYSTDYGLDRIPELAKRHGIKRFIYASSGSVYGVKEEEQVTEDLELLPISALADGLRQVLQHGAGFPVRDLVILAVWAVLGLALAARFFKWE